MKLKTLLKLTALCGAILMTGCSENQAQTEPCSDNDMQCWEQLAKAQWKAEHGEFQPNLTPEQEQAIQDYLINNHANH